MKANTVKTVKKVKISVAKAKGNQPAETNVMAAAANAQPKQEVKIVGNGSMEALKNFGGANKTVSGEAGAALNMLKHNDAPPIGAEEARKLTEYLDGLKQEFAKRLDSITPLMAEGIAENADADIRRVCSEVEEVINKIQGDLRKKLGAAWIKLFAEKMPANKTAKAYLARTAIAVGVAKLTKENPSAIKLPVNENGRWSVAYYAIDDQSLLYLVKNVLQQIILNEKEAEQNKIAEDKKGAVPFLTAIEKNDGASAIISIPNDGEHGGGLLKVAVADGRISVVEGYYGMAGLARKLIAKRITAAVSDVVSGNLEKRVPPEIFGLTIAMVKSLHRGYIAARDNQKRAEEVELMATVNIKDLLKGSPGIAKAFIQNWKAGDKVYHNISFFVERNDKSEIRVIYSKLPKLFANCLRFAPMSKAPYPLKQMFNL